LGAVNPVKVKYFAMPMVQMQRGVLLVDDDAFFAYCPNITQPLAVAALKDPLSTRTLE
jgi:hypothetical protein